MFNQDENSVVKARELGIIAERGAVKELLERINQLFLNIPYPHGKTDVLSSEASVQSHLLILLGGGNWDAQAEKSNELGRSDVVATFNDYTYVFELKLLRDKNQEATKTVDELLEEAVNQIKTHRYGEEVKTRHLIRLAMVFSEKERRFVKWQQVED